MDGADLGLSHDLEKCVGRHTFDAHVAGRAGCVPRDIPSFRHKKSHARLRGSFASSICNHGVDCAACCAWTTGGGAGSVFGRDAKFISSPVR